LSNRGCQAIAKLTGPISGGVGMTVSDVWIVTASRSRFGSVATRLVSWTMAAASAW
jgi:hypothetical protein